MMLQLCQDDPLLSLTRELFGANVVRVPDARIRPLSVVVHRAGRSSFRGSLLPLLTEATPLGVQPTISQLIDISGKRSRRVSLDLGVHILQGFLRGFGLPAAGVTSGLQGAAAISFTFPMVRRAAYDVNALGWALAGRGIDRNNPAAALLFDQPRYELLLIDSVLLSRHITLTASGSRGRKLNADVSALRKAITELGGQIGLESETDVELTLESPHELTFAFSCIRLFIDESGAITSMPPDLDKRVLGPGGGMQVRYSPDRIMLGDAPGMLMWDHE